MKTTTVTFKNSRGKTETVTFDIAARDELTRDERYALISDGFDRIGDEDLRDEDCATVEKKAAQQVGISTDKTFYIRRR